MKTIKKLKFKVSQKSKLAERSQLTHQADQQLCKGGAEIKPGPFAAQHPHADEVTWGPSHLTRSSVLFLHCFQLSIPPLFPPLPSPIIPKAHTMGTQTPSSQKPQLMMTGISGSLCLDLTAISTLHQQ